MWRVASTVPESRRRASHGIPFSRPWKVAIQTAASAQAPRVSTVRGSPYRDVNISLARKFAMRERLNFEVRAEAFNAFNLHYFTCDGEAFGDCIPF